MPSCDPFMLSETGSPAKTQFTVRGVAPSRLVWAALVLLAAILSLGTPLASAADEPPAVTTVTPANDAVGVGTDTDVTGEVYLPRSGQGVDSATLDDGVHLYRVIPADPDVPGDTDAFVEVAASRGTSGGHDVVVLTPNSNLLAYTTYEFRVTSALKDEAGVAFTPKTTRFTTGAPAGGAGVSARFQQTLQSPASSRFITSMAIGPDGDLYATSYVGQVLRFPVYGGGSLGDPRVVASFVSDEQPATTAIRRRTT